MSIRYTVLVLCVGLCSTSLHGKMLGSMQWVSTLDVSSQQRVKDALTEYEKALAQFLAALQQIKHLSGVVPLVERTARIKEASEPLSRALQKLQILYKELGVPVDEIEAESKLLCDACLTSISTFTS